MRMGEEGERQRKTQTTPFIFGGGGGEERGGGRGQETQPPTHPISNEKGEEDKEETQEVVNESHFSKKRGEKPCSTHTKKPMWMLIIISPDV